MSNTFATRATLHVNGQDYAFHSLPALGERFDL